MITPKEKAKELVQKMYKYQWRSDTHKYRNAKQCALIAVDEIETVLLQERVFESFDYWKQVKQEIEKL